LDEPVPHADLDGIEAARFRKLVHLRLVGKTGLHGAEPAHRTRGRIVRSRTDAVDDRVGDAVGAGRERARVRDDSGARRRVRAAVEDDRRADEDELALLRRAVRVEEPRGMTMHVTEELLAPVRHPHGAPRLEREQARMDLDRGVLAGAERAAHAREDDPHLRLRQPEAWRELVEVLVKPLRGDVERDAPVLTRYGEPGLRTERR